MMLFLDYSFFLLVDGSLALDDELKPDQLQLVDGDVFVASVKNNKIVLRKYAKNNTNDIVSASGSISG